MLRIPCLLFGFFLAACVHEFPYEEPLPPPPEPPKDAEQSPPPDLPPLPPVAQEEEIGSRLFWVNPDSPAARAAEQLRFLQPRDAALLKKIAAEPTATWFRASNRTPRRDAESLALAAVTSGRYLALVIAAIPKPDCAHYRGEGLDTAAYRLWLDAIAKGLGEAPVYIIMEPEALVRTGCLPATDIEARLALIAESVLVLKKNPHARVYIDAGQPGWLTVDEAVKRLFRSGVLLADGFALNVAGYEWTEDCIRYGQDISQKVGGRPFVIDSSRNGKGSMSRELWCNPPGRAIGQTPQAPTGIKGLDAYLWIKEPGESDGSCNGGPVAGHWWQAEAIDLARQAELPD